MSDLSTEILREIFTYFSSPLRVSLAYQFPWYLGQVCSQWRALFFSMRSTFWRKIKIDWLYNYWRSRLMLSPERITMILAFFLNRTQGAPFSFSFSHLNGYRGQDKKHMRWILKDLLDVHTAPRTCVHSQPFHPPLRRGVCTQFCTRYVAVSCAFPAKVMFIKPSFIGQGLNTFPHSKPPLRMKYV